MSKKELFNLFNRVLRENKSLYKVACNVITVPSISLLMMTVSYWNNQNYGLALTYNGKEIATVDSEETYEEANRMIKNYASYAGNGKSSDLHSPEYKVKLLNEPACSSAHEVKDKVIAESSEEKITEASGIYSDGKLIAVLDNSEDPQSLLDSILEESKLGDENAQTSFVENVESVSGLYPEDEIKSSSEVKDMLVNGIHSQTQHCVGQGESLESIADEFSTTTDEIKKSNGLDEEDVSEGDKLIIDITEFPVHVKTEKVEEVKDDIPFQTVREPDASQEEGWESVTRQGQNGEHVTVVKVTYVNRSETDRAEISSETVSEPVEQHIRYGTKKKVVPQPKSPAETKPADKSSKKAEPNVQKPQNGKLLWPVPFTHNITSKFGAVDGAFRSKPHSGIDISAAGIHGNDVLAAADGVVKFAGTANGYGNFIEITHANGMVTAYGHCESLYVKVGQTVKAGDRIASVGTTGNSTGYHLHFEVIVDGKRRNPSDYV